MAKPTDLPRWTDVTSGNRAEPSSGLKDTGYVAGDRPAAKHYNWLFYAIWEWILYLSALLGGSGVSETLKAGGFLVTGNGEVDGDLLCKGDVTLDDNTATFTCEGDADLRGPVTLESTVTANQDYKYLTARHRVVPAIDGCEVSGTDWSRQYYVLATVNDPGTYMIPITVESGERITVKLVCQHSVATASALKGELLRTNGATGNTSVGSANSAAATTVQTLTLCTDHNVVSDDRYVVEVTIPTAGVMDRSLYEVQVLVKRP